ncbi:hypothetical protein [Desulfitobacterium chlororespirans]|uniref:Uncharacterized protein n=1 Tax=Desulfitobacterium chlororespirans DSM 11544 TaxID=1121395 RepID=A0A1M7UGS3_9FIRM|nr:hypothetical protein [Desulfitobacterium chlororespirans]SHN82095.1 hypothetical protein SAMN02745215_03737 [Desulfitobacterium chlororespirans DSM 11544]
MNNWLEIWEQHPDVFIAQNWQECPAEKRKDLRLPQQYSYFFGGETALRVGIVASQILPKEEEFLLAGMLWANRLSNGARTVIYFIAPDFSPFLLHALAKMGGLINAKAVYWRERLSPSLYLIPEAPSGGQKRIAVGERRPNWLKWRQELNPVAQHQLFVVKGFFDKLAQRGVRCELKPLTISYLRGNIEIAEIKRKGKKFELTTKLKGLKHDEKAQSLLRQGWVDASGELNSEFCTAILTILDDLEEKERKGQLKPKDQLSLWLYQGGGILSSLWGAPKDWPWLPKDRSESWIAELGQWHYFEGNGQISVICPILDKPLTQASQAILLSSVLEKSTLLHPDKTKTNTAWDMQIHWLTLKDFEEELRLWLSWLKYPERYQVWILPNDWQAEGLNELVCRSAPYRERIIDEYS